MTRLTEVKAPEQWLVEVNGGYAICFTEVTLTADAVDGQVLTTATYGISGILSGDGVTGDVVRVMVRGNPSKVKASMLTGSTSALPSSIVLV